MSESPKAQRMLDVQVELFRRFFEESQDIIALKDKQDPTHTELLAVGSTLQAFYNGIERILVLCGKAFGDLDASKRQLEAWHQWLLHTMAQDTNARPALLSEDLHLRLLEYLKFRHVFRQTYVFELRWSLIIPLLRSLEKAYRQFLSELETFRGKATFPK